MGSRTMLFPCPDEPIGERRPKSCVDKGPQFETYFTCFVSLQGLLKFFLRGSSRTEFLWAVCWVASSSAGDNRGFR